MPEALEFGETQAPAAVLSYSFKELVELAAFTYRGRASRSGRARLDWGASVAFSPSDRLRGQFGYIADLADSRDALLSDSGRRYARRVGGLAALLSLDLGRLQVVAESVQALASFAELESDQNKPAAWNLELSTALALRWRAAFRVEGSDELEDAPRYQSGVALSWQPHRRVAVTTEDLWATYGEGIAEGPDNLEIENTHQFAIQLSLEL